MRRRSALSALSALSAGLLVGVATGALAAVPANADDAPAATSSPSAPATTTSTPTTTPTPTPTADPVDLRLSPAGSTGDPVATPHGTDVFLGYLVSGTSPGATLSVTLPAGLSATTTEVDGNAVTCTPATGTVVCDLGAVDGAKTVNVGVHVAASTPIGTLHVDATVTPVPGPDANPDDNSTTLDLDVVGRADVTQTPSTHLVEVPLGGSAPFTLTLHNNGPDPATGIDVRFTVQSNDHPSPALTGFTSDAVSQVNGGYEWTPGPLAVGASVALTVTITATSPALDSEITYSTSYDGVGEICGGSGSCVFGAQIRTTTATTTPGGPILAATGSDDGPLAAVGLGLLAGGAVLVVAARRRRAVV